MFKAIPMHTKPLKRTKNIEILTNYIKKTRFSQNVTQKSTLRNVFDDLENNNLRNRFGSRPPTFLKNTI
jgi:hypothetical protein